MADFNDDAESKVDLFSPEIIDLVSNKLLELRKRLLDFTRRNPLIHIKFRATSTSAIRVVDELPEVLRFKLTGGSQMRLAPLPALEEELPDEGIDNFLDALHIARAEDGEYLAEIEKIDSYADNAEEKELKSERALKDRLRSDLGMPPRRTKDVLSLIEHAKLHGISPSHVLPGAEDAHDDGRHDDDDIQTLLLPDRLSRSAKSILEKGRSFERETGVNVLHAAFGLLEWRNPGEREKFISPMLLMEIRIERRQSPLGAEFFIRGLGEVTINTNLDEKLNSEHGLALPEYQTSGENGGIEAYFRAVQDAQPPGWDWKVRREVCFGIFPSSKIAMYHDLDPAKRPLAKNEVVARMLATTGSGDGSYAETYETDDPAIAKTVPYLVMDADASQYSALVDVAGGTNLAIEGPPGSGKSQTIVNLIAAAIADGKKVLFVAEKLTALDVVKNRLEASGLGNFILPLQAGRSTSEIVYESIESRLEMGRGDARSRYNFETRQGALERRRAILQGYLDALGSNLGSTGLTVHQVIGHAIRTSEIRDDLPREIRRIPIPRVESLGEAAVEALVSEADAFGARLGRITRMPALWRAATRPITSRDTAEDIAATATEIAEGVEEYRHALSGSALSLLMPTAIFTAEISTISQLLALIEAHADSIDPDLIETLVAAGALRSVRELCGQIEEKQTVMARLARSLRDAEGWNIEARLGAARDFAVENGKSISPERHRSRLEKLRERISSGEITIAAAQRLPSSWTASGRKLSEIKGDANRIIVQDDAVLSIRRADPLGNVKDVAVEIEGRLSSLAAEIGRIRQALPDAGGSHDASQIRRAGETIEQSGVMRVFSGSYKAARNTYTNILRGRAGDSRPDMAQRMKDYADWLESRREFDGSARFTERFGSLFKGFNTEMPVIHAVVSFHGLCAEISGSSVDLKAYLETGDLAQIIAFAEIIEVPRLSLVEVQDQLAELKKQAAHEEMLIAEAEGHLQVFRDQDEIPLDEIQEIVARKASETALAERIDGSSAADIIGERFAGVDTATAMLTVECEIAEAFSGLDDPAPAIGALRVGALSVLRPEFEEFSNRRQKIDRSIATLGEDLGLEDQFSNASDCAERLDTLRTAAADPDSLLDRAQLKRAEDSLREQGFGELIDWAIGEGDDFDPSWLGPIVRAIIAKSMADAAYARHGDALQAYDGQEFDQIRAEIAQKDRELIDMSKRVIVNQLLADARPPAGNNIGRKSEFTEMSLIYNELHKKKRRVGLRDLTQRSGRALLELKPCWMMSPLAVAQYLHRGMQFDLVVIDEASQMTPENAVGALSRAGQAVIVGDTKQLPPTSFFQKVLDDSDTDEDLREDSESILDMANVAFMPVRQLRWHYRSRHSALIQFSNQWMYKGELTIFPSAQEDHPDLGVELIELPGAYKGRRNEIEARAIVQAAVHHMVHRPELSLGICTMNSDQKELILEEFERERDRNAKVQAFVEKWDDENDALEEFFIKNLETIQGDERDVMMISTLYGPETPGGKVLQRFGPINSAHGHRRLNVLFTRAKRKIVTFTSMKPTDILVDDNKNLGVRMFRAWLEYSKTGHIPDMAGPQGGTESPFEDYVAAQIERLGCEVVPQVGVAGFRIDLGIRHPDWPYGYILGVECDGAAYHSSKSSRDRDRLRQEVLAGLGWRLHRIWSTDWFRNPRKEIEVIKEVIADALARAKAQGVRHTEKLDALALLTRIAETTEPEAPAASVTVEPETIAPISSSAPARPQRSSLPIDPPQQNDLFTIAEAVTATEPSAALGSKVKIENLSDGSKKLAFTLVEGENEPDAGKIGTHTPLGEALLDAQVGDVVEYQVGSHIKEVRVLEIR
jgi:very-short-patch-repair endonuclease/RecA/RadA recombinase